MFNIKISNCKIPASIEISEMFFFGFYVDVYACSISGEMHGNLPHSKSGNEWSHRSLTTWMKMVGFFIAINPLGESL